MKLICIQDEITDHEGIPFINRKEVTKKISGLTKGNKYKVIVFNEISGSTTSGSGSVSSRLKFLVFNDDKQWETYRLSLFAPEE